MINQPENSDFLIKQINRQRKMLLYVILFSVGLLLFMLYYIFFISKRDKPYEENYKKEMGLLRQQFDSLRARENIIMEAALQLGEEVTATKKDKETSDKKLQELINQLKIFKQNGYEKINTAYVNVADDSLHRAFTERFKPKPRN